MRKTIIGTLLGLVIGCGAGTTARALSAEATAPNLTVPRWEQFCKIGSFESVAAAVRQDGKDGWELATMAASPSAISTTVMVCYKRPAS